MSVRKPSVFATSIRDLLEQSGSFSRKDWAEILRVSPSAISQWLGDYTVPRASTLRSLVDVAKRYCSATALDAFDRIAREPAETVSPFGDRMAPTVAHYMVEPIREAFLRILGTLSPKHQELILREASE